MAEMLKLKQERSRVRRQRIVDAATRLFGEHGIDGTSLTDIARTARVPLPSIYDYFPDKESIAVSVPARNFEELYAILESEATKSYSCSARLRRLYLKTFEYITNNPAWGRVFFLELWPTVKAAHPTIRQAIDQYAQHYIDLLKEGIAAGEFRRSLDPYLSMSMLMGTMSHLTAVWLLYDKPYDLQKKAEESFAMLRRCFEPAAR